MRMAEAMRREDTSVSYNKVQCRDRRSAISIQQE